jgi:hypothetical protein
MNKAPLSLIAKMLPALEELSILSEFGNNQKYAPESWLYWDNAAEAEAFAKKRLDSFARHALLGMQDLYSKDTETKMHHLAAAAWNALAIVTLIKKYELSDEVSTRPNFDAYRKLCLGDIDEN